MSYHVMYKGFVVQCSSAEDVRELLTLSSGTPEVQVPEEKKKPAVESIPSSASVPPSETPERKTTRCTIDGQRKKLLTLIACLLEANGKWVRSARVAKALGKRRKSLPGIIRGLRFFAERHYHLDWNEFVEYTANPGCYRAGLLARDTHDLLCDD